MSAEATVLAPTGLLRAAINFGNPVLAQRAPDGAARGVSAALAGRLAEQLGVPLQVVPFAQAGQVTDALASGVWDVCFLAIDPIRGAGIAFTEPYVLIEGAYAVHQAAPFRTADEVDRDGSTIVAVQGSAYELYLSRTLRHATLSRLPANDAAIAAFLADPAAVLAGVKQPLQALVARQPGTRLLPGRFMAIEQAMGTPKDRDPAGIELLRRFIAEAKRSGFVAQALAESGQGDAQVAN